MPLTKKGESMLKQFKREYGDRAEPIFYVYIQKYPKRTRSWHK